ncbi:uncharacterized protein EI90DRAFT_3012270 [Cantharellus anzutake]|uniref:uncharacterized protein n=1 Tax=Cantharellus anzutake TaxID=1750568 RepID=UPI0019074817|nr:uncharacterized protein EI90DRAFT_3012270 [Cantharellus anzutake]KAF8340387.1 hypothetical protein EI90DRAFT_3012270 [Cantharellus anzutake]
MVVVPYDVFLKRLPSSKMREMDLDAGIVSDSDARLSHLANYCETCVRSVASGSQHSCRLIVPDRRRVDLAVRSTGPGDRLLGLVRVFSWRAILNISLVKVSPDTGTKYGPSGTSMQWGAARGVLHIARSSSHTVATDSETEGGDKGEQFYVQVARAKSNMMKCSRKSFLSASGPKLLVQGPPC